MSEHQWQERMLDDGSVRRQCDGCGVSYTVPAGKSDFYRRLTHANAISGAVYGAAKSIDGQAKLYNKSRLEDCEYVQLMFCAEVYFA